MDVPKIQCGHTLPRCNDTNIRLGVCISDESELYYQVEPPRPWPVEVWVEVFFRERISANVNEGTMTFEMEYASSWNDPRLTVMVPEYYQRTAKEIPIPNHISTNMWHPKVQIEDPKSEERVRLKLVGIADYSFHSTSQSVVTIWCNTTYLDDYPFDHYECPFSLINSDGNLQDKVIMESFPFEDEIKLKREEFDFLFTIEKSQNFKNVCTHCLQSCGIGYQESKCVQVYFITLPKSQSRD